MSMSEYMSENARKANEEMRRASLVNSQYRATSELGEIKSLLREILEELKKRPEKTDE